MGSRRGSWVSNWPRGFMVWLERLMQQLKFRQAFAAQHAMPCLKNVPYTFQIVCLHCAKSDVRIACHVQEEAEGAAAAGIQQWAFGGAAVSECDKCFGLAGAHLSMLKSGVPMHFAMAMSCSPGALQMPKQRGIRKRLRKGRPSSALCLTVQCVFQQPASDASCTTTSRSMHGVSSSL